MNCPICNQLNTCTVQNSLISCVNFGFDKSVAGYKCQGQTIGRKSGFTWYMITPEDQEWDRKIELEREHAGKNGGTVVRPQSDKYSDKPHVTEPDDMPIIPINKGRVEVTARMIIKQLSEEKNPWNKIYYQGQTQEHQLVRILCSNDKSDKISRMDLDKFQCAINERMVFTVEKGAGKNQITVESPCPLTVAKQVFNKDRWPELQRLELISRIPVLTYEGKVLDTPGYHEDEAALLDFDPSNFDVKEHPTKDDAIKSLGVLLDVFKECCFENEVSRAGAIAMLLTAFSRNLYDFAPLFAISANNPGAGKGTIAMIVSLLLTGKPNSGLTVYYPDEVELSKQVLSALIEAPSIVNFDNIKDRFGGPSIETVFSTEIFKKRILGASKDAEASTKVLWTANGNNLTMTPDMSRRSILITLISPFESSQEREFERKDIKGFVLKNRGKIISAALTVLRAFLLAGSPKTSENPLNGFVPWDYLVRQCCLWLELEDPVESQKALDADDQEKETLRSLLNAWLQQYGPAPVLSADAINAARKDEGAFRSALMAVACDRHGQLSAQVLGNYLGRKRNNIVGKLRFEKAELTNSGHPWKVVDMAREPACEPAREDDLIYL